MNYIAIIDILEFAIAINWGVRCQVHFFAINLRSPLPMIYLILVGHILGVTTPIH